MRWMANRTRGAALASGAVALIIAAWGASMPAAQTGPAAAPSFTSNGELARPLDYREWAFVTSGLGMTYGPAASTDRAPMFDNVFVTPASYREFLRTGAWPDKTMFVLEIRESATNVSINNGGQTQGAVRAIEASVKDVQRFKATGGWAYFNFGSGTALRDGTAPLPATERCYQCHSTNTAVDNTFVQFYPTLFDAAKKLGTVKPTYDLNHKP